MVRSWIDHVVRKGNDGIHVDGLTIAEKNGWDSVSLGENTSILVEFDGPDVNLNRARCLGMFQSLRPVVFGLLGGLAEYVTYHCKPSARRIHISLRYGRLLYC